MPLANWGPRGRARWWVSVQSGWVPILLNSHLFDCELYLVHFFPMSRPIHTSAKKCSHIVYKNSSSDASGGTMPQYQSLCSSFTFPYLLRRMSTWPQSQWLKDLLSHPRVQSLLFTSVSIHCLLCQTEHLLSGLSKNKFTHQQYPMS